MLERTSLVIFFVLFVAAPGLALADEDWAESPAAALCSDKNELDMCAEEKGICMIDDTGDLYCRFACILELGETETDDHEQCPEWASTCVSELGGQLGFCK